MRPREQSSSSMNTSDISMFNSFLAGEIYTDASLLPFQCTVLSADMPIPVVEMPVIASQNVSRNVSRRPDEIYDIYEMQPLKSSNKTCPPKFSASGSSRALCQVWLVDLSLCRLLGSTPGDAGACESDNLGTFDRQTERKELILCICFSKI